MKTLPHEEDKRR